MKQSPEINLIAQASPQHCARNLQAFVQSQSRPLNRLDLRITRLENGTHHFRITRSIYNLPTRRRYRRMRGGRATGQSNYVKVEAHGYLVRWADSNSTIVIGDTMIDQKTFLINGLFLLGFALAMLALTWIFLTDYLFIAPLVVLAIVSFAHTTLMQSEDLAQKHRRSLAIQVDRVLRQSVTVP